MTPGGVNTSLRRINPQLVFKSAHGAILTDVDDNEYIDYHAAFGPILLGHSYEPVSRRVLDALQEIDLIGVGTTEWEIRLAQKIRRHVPSAQRVLFCNSGSEATYQAIRLARAVTGRKKIVKFQGCYHGWHDSVLMNVISSASALGRRDVISAGSLPEVTEHTLVARFNDLDDVARLFEENKNTIAALILEPIPHNVGCLLPKPGFLEGLREITAAHEAILIFDEVITGFRHSLGGYQTICGVMPDLTTLGKSMANGHPIAALCGRAELLDHFNTRPGGTVFFAGTYNGHAASCAAALATIETIEGQAVHARIFELGHVMRQGLQEIVERRGIRATVAGFGSVFVLYFLEGPIEHYEDLLRNDQELFVNYRRGLVERGIFEIPVNLKRSHISFSHTPEHVARSLQAAEDVLKHVRDLTCV